MRADWKLKVVNKSSTVEHVQPQQQGVIPITRIVHKVVMAGTIAGTNVEFGFVTPDNELVKDFIIGEFVDVCIKVGKQASSVPGVAE
jgi:hypothetical protein